MSTPQAIEKRFLEGTDLGLVGEIDVRRELAAEGWLAINTNTEKGNFPNVDLIAAKGVQARGIQIKTSDGEKGSHAHRLYMGRGQAWLTAGLPFYNAKPGPLRCSVVVLVQALRHRSRFVILPVGLAEFLARRLVEAWYKVPKRDGAQRSAGFDARPQFSRLENKATEFDAQVMSALLSFEDCWSVLDWPTAELEDLQAWETKWRKGEARPLQA